MRIVNILRNSIYSLLSFFFLSLMGIYIRKLFNENLPVELLGLEGLFSNIISILSLAELGVSSVINYSLYKALAENDEKEINILMNIYRFMYKIIGVFILGISIILFFFLPKIINNTELPWNYIELVYVIQIITVLSTYFIAYKRTLFVADQKDYICIKIDTVCRCLANIVRIIAIVFYHSYIFYALTALFFNILSNIIISINVNKKYKFLTYRKVSYSDICNRNFFKDIKNFMIHKIAYILYGGADSIIITAFLGLHTAGLLANYLLIHSGIYSIMYKCFQGIIPTLGNLVYSESEEKKIKIYNTVDLMYTFLGAYICCIYILFFQKFISLFFGAQFLLPDGYVWLLAFNVFLAIQFENACNYRNTYGSFEKDRLYMIMSAVTKVILSILFVEKFGIIGLMMGTIVGLVFIVYGRLVIVFKYIFNKSICKYLIKHIVYSSILFLEIIFIEQILDILNIPVSYSGLIIEGVIATLSMIVFNIIIFCKNSEFRNILMYLENIKNIFKAKFK